MKRAFKNTQLFNMGGWSFLFLALFSVAVQCRVMPKIRGPSREEATPGEFPFFGFIMNIRTHALITSGVLIKPKVFLTLGNNYYGGAINPSDIQVVFGTHNRSKTEETALAVTVESIHIHPELINTWQGAKTGDLALIKLKTDVTLGRRIKLFSVRNINGNARLDNQLERSGNCVSMGYGLIRHNYYEQVYPRTLQKNEPHMRSRRFCEEFADDNDIPWPKKRWLCSLNEDGTETRPGDGGNLLVCTIGNSTTPLLHGLASGGIPGYERQGFTYYTQLSTYKDWIVENAKKLQK